MTSLYLPAEICQWESFKPICKPNHVILVTDAHYGRLKPGRCTKKEYGHLGK